MWVWGLLFSAHFAVPWRAGFRNQTAQSPKCADYNNRRSCCYLRHSLRYGAAVGVVIQRTIWGAAGAGRWAEYCYSRHILNLRFVGVGCYRAHISPLVLAELFCLHFRLGQPTAHISPVGKVGTFLLGHGYPVPPVGVLLSAAQFWFGLRLRGVAGFAGIFPRRVVIHGTIWRGLGGGQPGKTGCYRRHSFHGPSAAANLRNFARGIVIQRTFPCPFHKHNQRNNVFYSALNYSCYREHSLPPACGGPRLVCRCAGVVICSTISKILWACSRGASCYAAPLLPPRQPPPQTGQGKNPAGCYSAHIFHKVP